MGFSSMCKTTTDKCDVPSSWATEKKSPSTMSVFLKEAKSNSNFGPFSGKAGGSRLVKYLDAALDLIYNGLFG